MTDMDAAEYLRELQEGALAGGLRTGRNPSGDGSTYHCALAHAVRALEERAYPLDGRRAPSEEIQYRRLPNGSYRHEPPETTRA